MTMDTDNDADPGGRAGPDLVGRGLVVVRGGKRVLDGVDARASAGAVLAVTGPSGSGKSTLLAVFAGLVEPDAGRVVRPASGPTGRVGIVLQGYGLLPVLTAAENVELPLQIAGLAPAEIAVRAREALRWIGLHDVDDRLTEELSGGQQQRVAVARALVVAPLLLVADEPTAELDESSAQIVLTALRAEADRGATVVLATHDPAIAAACDTEVHLVDGRVTN